MKKDTVSILLYKYYIPSDMKLYIDINKNYCISYCNGLLDYDYNRYTWFRFNFNLKKIKVIHHIKYNSCAPHITYSTWLRLLSIHYWMYITGSPPRASVTYI